MTKHMPRNIADAYKSVVSKEREAEQGKLKSIVGNGVRTMERRISGVRIVYNKLLGGWFVVRGPHQSPLSGKFATKAEAFAWLLKRSEPPPETKPSVWRTVWPGV